MKKFLTVLLALSVVFTYTVGSVFALGEPTDQNQKDFNKMVDDTASEITGIFNANFDKAVAQLKAAEVDTGWSVSADSWKAVAAEYKTAQLKAIADRSTEMKETYAKASADTEPSTTGWGTLDSVEKMTAVFLEAAGATVTDKDNPSGFNLKTAAVNPYKTVAEVVTAIQDDEDIKLAAAKAEFAAIKSDAQLYLGYVDISMYSKTVKTINGKETSYYAMAEKFVADQTSAVNDEYLLPSDGITEIKGKAVGADSPVKGIGVLGGTKGFMSYFEKAADGSIVISSTGKTAANLVTMEEEGSTQESLAIAKQKALGIMNQNAAAYLEDGATTAPQGYTKKDIADAYITAQTYRINNATSKADIESTNAPAALTGGSKINNPENYVKNVAGIKELEAYADRYKAEKDEAGNLVRDAKAVQKVIDDAKDAAYNNTGSEYSALVADKAKIRDNCYVSSAKTDYVIGKQKAAIEAARKADLYTAGKDNYYEPEKARINALYDALIAKVDAAATDDEVKAVGTSISKGGILNKAQIVAQIQTFAGFTKDFANLQNYMKYLNGTTSSYDAAYKDFSAYNAAYFADLYAEEGVRANADITAAMYNKATAVLDAVKSNGALDTEKKAVEALVKALPKVIQLSDKAAVEAAWAANETYMGNEGAAEISNKAALDSAISDLFNAELREANKLYNALPSTLTVADKAAVKAYGDALKAIDENVAKDKIYDGKNLDTAKTNYKNAVEKIREIELKAVKDAINALPINITAADKAAVEAARALYDAFIADYTVYADDDFANAYDAVSAVNNRTDLFAAEVAVKAATRDDAVKAVEALKITASSTAGKGYIKVKWSVKGDASYADGYQVYRSTKRNSGFGTKPYFTTKNKTYKNTKSLKKGKRYYYKVRAYVEIDGQKYYSDWSNKAYRIAK